MTLLASVITAKGQDPKGELYWVVESNKHLPDQSQVKIYDQHNGLVHEVKLDTRLDVTKRKHRKFLVQMIKRYSARESVAGKKTRSKSSV